jgi:ankyrin repeat protein
METLALLASRGADPRVRDDAGETAADLAQRRGHAAFAAACRDGETVFSFSLLRNGKRISFLSFPLRRRRS